MNFHFNFRLDRRLKKDSDGNVIKKTIFPIKVNLNCDDPSQRNYDFSIPKVRLPQGDFIELRCTEEDFSSAWTNRFKTNNSGHQIETTVYVHRLDIRTILKVKEDILNEIIERPEVFSFKDVKEAFTTNNVSKRAFNVDVYAGFDSKIKELAASGRYGSASQYKSTKNMICKYMSGLELTFYHIDVNWLDSYYRARSKSASVSTVSLDLRNLKAIYNIAKEQDDRLIIKYPFGKGKYQIPEGSASRNIGLSDESLKKIQDFESDNYYLQTARDYFMFSYYSNGLNLKDILLLEKGQETFTRAKSRNTAKKEVKMYAEHNEHQLNIISRHKGSGKYLFNVLNDDDDDQEIYTKTKATLRRVAKQLKNLAKELDLSPDLSYQWARHSYATKMVKEGVNIKDISESMGHTNIKTTESYIKSLDQEGRKKINRAKEL